MLPIAILHEGNNNSSLDNKLLKNLITYLKLDANLVEFYGMGVKSNFFNISHPAYKVLTQRIKEKVVKKVLFIVDADYVAGDNENYNGFDNTEKQLKAIIKELAIEEISSFYIMCDPDNKKGYIESLILSSLPTQRKSCIEQFLICSGFEAKDGDKSTYERIYKSLAHPFSPYNFDHRNFELLKNELKNLFV